MLAVHLEGPAQDGGHGRDDRRSCAAGVAVAVLSVGLPGIRERERRCQEVGPLHCIAISSCIVAALPGLCGGVVCHTLGECPVPGLPAEMLKKTYQKGPSSALCVCSVTSVSHS
jgi:hypothetical protein